MWIVGLGWPEPKAATATTPLALDLQAWIRDVNLDPSD